MASAQAGRSTHTERRRQRGHGNTQRANVTRGSHAQVQLNRAICQAGDRHGIEGILSITAANYGMMSFVNMSTAIHRLGSLHEQDFQMRDDPRFDSLCALIQRELHDQLTKAGGEVTPRCWATIAWSFAKLHRAAKDHEHVLQLIAALSLPCISQFKSFELANLLWAYAKSKICSRKLFDAAISHIETDFSSFSHTNLSTIAWACATAEHSCHRFLHRAVIQFLHKADTNVNAVELSNLMWSLSTAQVCLRGSVYKQVADLATGYLSTFKIQELSIFLWSFSRSGILSDDIFLEAAELLSTSFEHQKQLHPQGVANIFWAFSKQVELNSSVSKALVTAFHKLTPRCACLLPLMKPQEVSCVFKAASTLSLFGQDTECMDVLFHGLACTGMSLYPECSLNQLTQLLKDTGKIVEHYQTLTEAQAAVLVGVAGNCTSRLAVADPCNIIEVLELMTKPHFEGIPSAALLIEDVTELAIESIKYIHDPMLVRYASLAQMLPDIWSNKLMAAIVHRSMHCKMDALIATPTVEHVHDPLADESFDSNTIVSTAPVHECGGQEIDMFAKEKCEASIPKGLPLYSIKNTFVELYDTEAIETGNARLKANKFYSVQVRKAMPFDIGEISTDSESDGCNAIDMAEDSAEECSTSAVLPHQSLPYSVKNTFVEMYQADDIEMDMMRLKANKFISEKPRVAAAW